MNCAKQTCESCGDVMVHLNNRGQHESSSGIGQFVHDNLPVEFYYMDADAIVYKRDTRIMRLIEHKFGAQKPSFGQMDVLPRMARMIRFEIEAGRLSAQSGAFMLSTDKDFTAAVVRRILPESKWRLGPSVELPREELKRFLSGQVME